jgi:hypothetical protein
MNATDTTDVEMTCSSCGATIYREHIDRHIAGMWAGQLLCPTCLRQQRGADSPGHADDEIGDVPLVPPDVDAPGGSAESIADTDTSEGMREEFASRLAKRRGARRVRTFHAKLSEAALNHLDDQVNTWLAAHPEIEIRFAHTTVGTIEAKHAEPHLILTVFY